MDKSSFFSSLGGYLKANKAFFLVILIIVLVTGGYFWWQSGFSFEIGRFFAYTPPGPEIVIVSGQPLMHGQRLEVSWSANTAANCNASAWIDTGGRNEGTAQSDPIDACHASYGTFNISCYYTGQGSGTTTRSFAIDASSCPTSGVSPTPDTSVAPTIPVTPAGLAYHPECSASAFRWDNGNGVTGCEISNTFNAEVCTMDGDGRTLTRTIGIVNHSTTGVYARTALYYCPVSTCSAVDQRGPGCTTVGVSGVRSGDSSVAAGASGKVTYSFVPGADCGTYQLDDTWGPNENAFDIIGKVINTGKVCPTPTVTVTTTPTTTVTTTPTTTTTTPTHLVCDVQSRACVSVVGAGQNECATNADCVPATHSVCNEQHACVSVTGAGQNQCSIDADCQTARPLACAPNDGHASINQSVVFSATGGTGSYVWYAPGGNGSSGQQGYSVSYATPGHKTVTVVSGNDQATCTVDISQTVASSPPPGRLACAPERQDGVSGSPVQFTATGGSQACGSQNTYQWTTSPNGVPAEGSGCNFTSTFTNSDAQSRAYIATVRDGEATATCTVNVACQTPVCQDPPPGCVYENATACSCGTLVCPSTSELLCAPASQTVNQRQVARLNAAGGTSYAWSAPEGTPSSASSGAAFSVSYRATGRHEVVVTSGSRSATCVVNVRGGGSSSHLECRNNTCERVSGSGTSECSVEGASCGSSSFPRLSIVKLVRNVTQSTEERDSVTANPGNTVEFSVRVSSDGSATVNAVTMRDALPAGLTYVPGSTTVDGAAASDGLTTFGLSLGDMPPGRTITVHFRAVVTDASFFSSGTTVLTNTAFARGSNAPEVSDVAFVTVSRSSGNVSLSLTKLGRNVTRGETDATSPVHSSPAQTIEFMLHVRNTSGAALTNVMLRDILPSEITLIRGSVRVNGVAREDVLTASGLSLGTFAPGQEAEVTFSGLVATAGNLPKGRTTVINTATVTASGVPTLTAQLPIIIINGVVVPPVDTGPGETTVLALIISAIITLLYVGYTSTETYRRHEAGSIAKESQGDRGTSNFNK